MSENSWGKNSEFIMIHPNTVSIIWPTEARSTVHPLDMMKIHFSRPTICSFVPCGCCPTIGRLVYPCEEGIQKGYEVQSWYLRDWKTVPSDPTQCQQHLRFLGDSLLLWLPALPARGYRRAPWGTVLVGNMENVLCFMLIFLPPQLQNNDKSKYLGPGLFWWDEF